MFFLFSDVASGQVDGDDTADDFDDDSHPEHEGEEDADTEDWDQVNFVDQTFTRDH
jgi:hypothetical protein